MGRLVLNKMKTRDTISHELRDRCTEAWTSGCTSTSFAIFKRTVTPLNRGRLSDGLVAKACKRQPIWTHFLRNYWETSSQPSNKQGGNKVENG